MCRELNTTEHEGFLLSASWAGKGGLQRGWSDGRQVSEDWGEGRGRSPRPAHPPSSPLPWRAWKAQWGPVGACLHSAGLAWTAPDCLHPGPWGQPQRSLHRKEGREAAPLILSALGTPTSWPLMVGHRAMIRTIGRVPGAILGQELRTGEELVNLPEQLWCLEGESYLGQNIKRTIGELKAR